MWFFSADWHLGHANIIKYCKRPFLSREEEGLLAMIDRGAIPARDLRISPETTNRMTDTIIDSTNAVVGPDDNLVVIGDFCWTPRDGRYDVAKKFRDRINCKNMFLIWGNHDDRRFLSPTKEIVAQDDGRKYWLSDEAKALFKACYDQYVFNVDGQHIFCSHYPCRSWDMAHHGSWDLYGHVHDLYGPEDNGDLMPYQKKVFTEGFHSVLERYGLTEAAARGDVVADLLAVCASLNGIDLTVDVGVDNRIRGEAVPFGTPWSMTDLRSYMGNKKSRWDARSDGYRNLRPASSLKGGNPKADPKF